MKSGEDEETVVPAGTSPHNAPSVLPAEWESTTVAVFVTSSSRPILHEAPASRGLAASHKHTCICLSWTAQQELVAPLHSGRNVGRWKHLGRTRRCDDEFG